MRRVPGDEVHEIEDGLPVLARAKVRQRGVVQTTGVVWLLTDWTAGWPGSRVVRSLLGSSFGGRGRLLAKRIVHGLAPRLQSADLRSGTGELADAQLLRVLELRDIGAHARQ